MTTITLVQNAETDATGVHSMTARPMNVNLAGLAGGPTQFRCTNLYPAIAQAREVEITYNANFGGRHETIQVSSVQP